MDLARASRKKKISSRMRVLSLEDRIYAAQQRLASLEADNFLSAEKEAKELLMAEVAPSRAAKVHDPLGPVARKKTSVPVLVEEARFSEWPRWVPNYATATAPPSERPKRNWCATCGFKAGYTCERCGMKLCSRACQTTHSETRCLNIGN
jgi:zinc finger HIT domain-containing protein 1